ncbi:MAG: protein kinase domain-containing protein [Myxococcota bacterium]
MSEQIIIPTPGDLVADKYRIERELGRGAYGVVFLATQEGIDRKVAVKTLLPKAFFEEGIAERFEREAKFVGRLNHPNIVRVYDYGQHEKLLYMAVEYVEGFSLEEIIEADAPLEPERTRQFVYQMLDALAHAHERGIIHRDLKPGNILVVEEALTGGETREVVKILDFGIAKLIQDQTEDENMQTLTQDGTVLGTPHYMSPESIVGESVDHTVDLYALGVIIYEMLTGRRPFTAKNSPSVMVRHLRDDPPPLPQHLEDSCWGEVVRKCMEKQPRFRIDSPEEIREILDRRDEAEAPEWWTNAAPTEQLAHLETMQRERTGTTEQRDELDDEKSGPSRAVGAILAGILVGAVIAVAFWIGRDTGPTPDPAGDEPAAAMDFETADDPDEFSQIDDQPTMRADGPTRAGDDAGDEAEHDAGDGPADADDDEPEDKHPAAPESAQKDAAQGADAPKRAPAEASQASKTRPEKPARVTLQMESTPKGARVKVDGRPVGTTPTEVELERSSEKVEIIFSHIGYQPKTERVAPNSDQTVSVRLEKGRLKLIP